MKKTKIVFLQRQWEDNLGVLWISALLKQHGFSCEIIIEEPGTYEEVAKLAPDLIGYSCMTGQQDWVLESIRKVRQAGVGALVVMGGPHPTFFPEVLMNGELDGICRGEGEFATLELVEALEIGAEYTAIQNFSWKIGGEVVANSLRPLLEDLDQLPMPDRSYYERYKFLRTNPFKIFITGRGCPFKCTFCFNHALHAMYGTPALYVRRRSVEKVLEELEYVDNKWGIKEVRFSDDHFALSSEWLRKFAPLYKHSINKPYTVNARVDILNEARVKLLGESGCRLLCFGIETGREDLRNRTLEKKITDVQIFAAAQLLRKYGIRFLTSNIIGLPGEAPGDAWKTIAINQKIRTNLPWYSMMQYFPGTKIFQDAVDAGIISNDFDPGSIKNYFENKYITQDNMNELHNIHSFSILVSRLPLLTPLAKYLARRFKHNMLFRLIFKASYIWLTIKRANFDMTRLLTGYRYYLKGL
ncbi:MAG: B12-binding domain-containing radical SAM protein [Proteobacteria bacterium]|nr:B12-binding domain-containing radical SAM protein [Pseudomonadota bacterium]MBU1594600.1 B12-binding domain-containing radical SAM protein [Pseudomonadota bacterium]